MSRFALAVVALGVFISVSAEHHRKDTTKCETCGPNIDTIVQVPDHIQNNYGRSNGKSYITRNDRGNEDSMRHGSDYRRDGGRSEEDGSRRIHESIHRENGSDYHRDGGRSEEDGRRRNHDHRENGGSDCTSDRHDRDRYPSSNNHYQRSSHSRSNRGDSGTDIRHYHQNPVVDSHHNSRSYHNSHGYDNSHRRRDDDDDKKSYSHRRFSSSRHSNFRRDNNNGKENRGYGSSKSRRENRHY